jgi:hypothetical protein
MTLIQRASGRRSVEGIDTWQRIIAKPHVLAQPPPETPDITDYWLFLTRVKYLKTFDGVEYRITLYGSRAARSDDFTEVLGGWITVKRIPPDEFDPNDIGIDIDFGPWALSYRKGRGTWRPIRGARRLHNELHGFGSAITAAIAAKDHATSGAWRRKSPGFVKWTDPWRQTHPTPQMKRKRLARADWD